MHAAMPSALPGAAAPWMRLARSFQERSEFNEQTGGPLTMSLPCLRLLMPGIQRFIVARREERD